MTFRVTYSGKWKFVDAKTIQEAAEKCGTEMAGEGWMSPSLDEAKSETFVSAKEMLEAPGKFMLTFKDEMGWHRTDCIELRAV